MIPAVVNSPTPLSSLVGPTVTFNWTAGATPSYWLKVGYTQESGVFFDNASLTGTTATVSNLPTNGATIYATFRWWDAGVGNWHSPPTYYSYRAYSGAAPPQLVSPPAGSVLPASRATLTWISPPSSTRTWVQCGTAPGNADLLNIVVTGHSATIPKVPSGTKPVSCQIASSLGETTAWVWSYYNFQPPAGQPVEAPKVPSIITFPSTGDALLPGYVTFQWSQPSGAPSYSYYFSAGSTPTGTDIAAAQEAFSSTSRQILVPVGTGRVYVTLITNFVNADLTSAGEGTTSAVYGVTNGQSSATENASAAQLDQYSMWLSSNRQEANFTWSPSTAGDLYWLTVGSGQGLSNLYNSRNIGSDQPWAKIYNVPTGSNATLYATLYTRIDNVWYSNSRNWIVPSYQESVISTSFRTCIATANSTCTLLAGTYFFGDSTKVNGIPVDNLNINAPLVVSANNVTIQGSGTGSVLSPKTVFARVGVPLLKMDDMTAGCRDMITISGVLNVTVRDVTFDGGGLAYARNCVTALTNGGVPNQPGVIEINIAAKQVNATTGIVVDNVVMRNSIGRSIQIYGSNDDYGRPSDALLSNVTIQNSTIEEAQLTGILIGWNNAWDYWLPLKPGQPPLVNPPARILSPTVKGCDSPDSTAALARVSTGILIRNVTFIGHWTGTVAISDSLRPIVQDSFFYNNYTENSWDGAGGTMFEDACVESSIWERNIFDNLGVTANVDTPAFEFYGRGRAGAKTYIRNNVIYNQPARAMDISSAEHVEITGNYIQDAARDPQVKGGIVIQNIGGWRGTSNINVSGNTIQNTGGFMEYGIGVGGCVFRGCNGLSTITIGSNVFGGMPSIPICAFTEPTDPPITGLSATPPPAACPR